MCHHARLAPPFPSITSHDPPPPPSPYHQRYDRDARVMRREWRVIASRVAIVQRSCVRASTGLCFVDDTGASSIVHRRSSVVNASVASVGRERRAFATRTQTARRRREGSRATTSSTTTTRVRSSLSRSGSRETRRGRRRRRRRRRHRDANESSSSFVLRFTVTRGRRTRIRAGVLHAFVHFKPAGDRWEV